MGDAGVVSSSGAVTNSSRRGLGFGVSVAKSRRYGDGGGNGVFLILVSRFWLPGRKNRRGREALPPALP